MKLRSLPLRLAGALCAFALAGTALPSFAATGIAWDQVTKFSMDGSVPAPNFAPDFQKASQPPPPPRGGMFGLGSMVSAAQGAMAMFQNGMAERHYVAGNLRRTDNVGAQTATIIDCGARTITYLDLGKKTYRVESMDKPAPSAAPSGPSHSGPSGGPPKDDGTRYKISYDSQALGPKQLDGVNADGYSATMAVTATKPSGDSQTYNTTMTAYYSAYAEPQQSCPAAAFDTGGIPGGPGPMASMGASMAMMNQISAAMRTPSGDPRFTFSSSGPKLPSGKLDLFSAWQMQGSQAQGGRGFTMTVERGNVHQVNDGDQSIFGIPPGFTKTS